MTPAPLIPETVQAMTPPRDSYEVASTGHSDPWDWTVDEVVTTLCGRTHSLLASLDPRSLPDPVSLEAALRENGVSGPTLLLQLDHTSLRHDLGVKALGPRGTILQLITTLRRQSPKYLNNIYEEAVATPLPGYGRVSKVGQDTRLGSPYHESPFYYAPRAISISSGVLRSPIMLPGRCESPAQPHVPADEGSIHPMARPDDQHPSLTHEGPELQASDHQGPRRTDTIETTSALNTAVSIADDSSSPQAATDPGVIGFDAKETDMEDHNILSIAGPTHRVNETFVLDKTGRKRRRLVLDPVKSSDSFASNEPVYPHAAQAENISSTSDSTRDTGSDTMTSAYIEEAISKEQETYEVQLLREPKTSAFDSNEQSSPCLPINDEISTPLEAVTEPGFLVIDGQGRKRMRPILVSQPNAKPPGNNAVQEALTYDDNSDKLVDQGRNAATRKPIDSYLGLQSFPVEKIFYDSIAIGKQLENENMLLDTGDRSDINTCYRRESNGLSRYINSRMKHFLSAKLIETSDQNGEKAVGIVPYPSRIARLHQQLSMTLFNTSKGKLTVLRVDRAKWLKTNHPRSINRVDLDADPMTSQSTTFDLPLKHLERDDQDWGHLEKWNYAGDDEILPTYGESGSEGEYDMDTWLEMEKESGKIERPLGKRNRQKLNIKTVEETMDQVLSQIVQDWHSKQEPKLQTKARRLWVKSKRDRNKQEQIDEFANTIDNLQIRLIKLREEIAKEEWSTVINLSKQCKIMQPSVFDLEYLKWKIAILNLDSAPEKLSISVVKSKIKRSLSQKVTFQKDEEIPESTVSDVESSDEDMDGFVVPDDVDDNRVLDDEAAMTGIGEEQASDTSVDDEIQPVPMVIASSSGVSDPQTPQTWSKESTAMTIAKNDRTQQTEIIDLTQQSETEEPDDTPIPKPKRSVAIRTPPLYSSDDDPFVRSRRIKPFFKMPPIADSVIDLESDSAYSTAGDNDQVPLDLPNLQDTDNIKKLSSRFLVERGDRKRLLLWHIARTGALDRGLAFSYLENVDQSVLERSITLGLNTMINMKTPKHRIRGWDDEDSATLMRIAAWLVCWTIPVALDQKSGLKKNHVDTVLADKECFQPFWDFLITCPILFRKNFSPEVVSLDPEGPTPSKNKRQKILPGVSDEERGNTQRKKRKFVLPESQATLDLRAGAQQRVQERDNRQKQLKRRLREMGAKIDSSQVVVNTGKFDHQEFIFLNPIIGDRIQPHQIEGVQFMWREITADFDNLQGCLLAQTMGLGKTMQVIALLVKIAEAAKSSSVNVRNQVPPKLRASRTLILCPPALIENWWEEFLMWTPMPTANNVGDIRKVTTSLKPKERLWEIQAWMDEGGILLMGFNTFRAYIDNKAKKVSGTPLDEDQRAIVEEALLKRPAIVVADEAHALKNAGSGINRAMSRIETKSRIALTGSPLMNNLEEYYSLIDWIAPNYLGTLPEFRANFVEPIQGGFYQESTYADYRHAMKKLEALKTDLEPKTHRADISVLEGLKEKQEFVIRVPLTELQEQVYRIYVDCMLSASKEVTLPRLWAWLATLQLLCNHPKCFRDRLLAKEAEEASKNKTALTEKERESQRSSALGQGSILLDDHPAYLEEPVSSIGITETMAEKQLKPFITLTEPLTSITLAHKMQILMDILEFSKQAGDKVLVFSHSIATLDFIEAHLRKSNRNFSRIDGKTRTSDRQQLTKAFNVGQIEVFLISIRAGGQGLNMYGANRVVILDGHFNPMYEEQAVGRAYRLGQMKPVFVYYLTADGTFEEGIQNQSLFKQHLAKRVVDDKKPIRLAKKGVGQYLFPPKAVGQQDLQEFKGKDPLVLDRILAKHEKSQIIRSMDFTETFHKEDDMKLTEEEKKEAEQMQRDIQFRRRNSSALHVLTAAQRDPAHATFAGAGPASRPLWTQESHLKPSYGINKSPPHLGLAAARSPIMTSPFSQQLGTASVPGVDTHLLLHDQFRQTTSVKNPPSASVPPARPPTPGSHPRRRVSELLENGPSVPRDLSKTSSGSLSPGRPSLDSRLNYMPSPKMASKLHDPSQLVPERPRKIPDQETEHVNLRETGVNSLPPQPARSKGLGAEHESDGEDLTRTATNIEPKTMDEQGLFDNVNKSLKRKREEDLKASDASPGPMSVMFKKLLNRELKRRRDAET